MTTESKTYNGWTNYETWNVKLWMDNEEGSYRYWQEQAQDAYDEASAGSYRTRDESASADLADRLKNEHEEHMGMFLDSAKASSSVWADLLGAALSEVNWDEIATSLIEDVDKTDYDAEEDEE